MQLNDRWKRRIGRHFVYPFSDLDQNHRTFLNALADPAIATIGQAFKRASVLKPDRHAALERWLDNSLFIDALFATFRRMPPLRREQVFRVICEFLHKQPIGRICELPRARRKPGGWHRHAVRSHKRKQRATSKASITLSQKGEDPWH